MGNHVDRYLEFTAKAAELYQRFEKNIDQLEEELVGWILDNYPNHNRETALDVAMATTFRIALERNERLERHSLLTQLENMSYKATMDPRTGAQNAAAFNDGLRLLINKLPRPPICILFFDCDNFKAVNKISYDTGNKLLLKVATVLIQESIQRTSDVVYRWGGDEFTLIVTDISLEDARKVGLRIRNGINRKLRHIPYFYGISAGVILLNGPTFTIASCLRTIKVIRKDVDDSDLIEQFNRHAHLALEPMKARKER